LILTGSSSPSLCALVRGIGETATTGRLLQDVFEEVWGQPLLERRSRAKPHEIKGTPAFVRVIQRTPPGPPTNGTNIDPPQ